MLEGLLGVLLEFVLSLLGEFVAEAGFHTLAAPFHERPHPLVAALGYTAYGAGAGALSALLVDHFLIAHPTLALVNLAVAPVLSGLAMAGVGALRRRRGQSLVRLDSFVYGWLFAAAFVLTRFAILTYGSQWTIE